MMIMTMISMKMRLRLRMRMTMIMMMVMMTMTMMTMMLTMLELSLKDHGPEPVLPSLGYSQRQLFWLSFASTWCSVYRPEVLKLRLVNDYYSPEVFRVNGPLSNMAEFARDWSCPPGSAMAPVKRCSVWR